MVVVTGAFFFFRRDRVLSRRRLTGKAWMGMELLFRGN